MTAAPCRKCSNSPRRRHSSVPLSADIDLGGPPSALGSYAEYSLWFGYQWSAADGHGLFRQRDQLVFGGDSATGYEILMSDRDTVAGDVGYWISGHPDFSYLREHVVNNADWRQDAFDSTAGTRGPVDLNFLFTDGRVETVNRITTDDPRMNRVPRSVNVGLWPSRYNLILKP